MTTHIDFPLIPSSVAIILNGERDSITLLKNVYAHYDVILVCDGAWHDAIKVVSVDTLAIGTRLIALGDGDSIIDADGQIPSHFLKIEDTLTTDFEKALQWIIKNNLKTVTNDAKKSLGIDVFWANGGQLDHTLGNLALASKYADQLTCHFYTNSQYYRYVNTNTTITHGNHKTISIFPFPECTIKSTQGLLYPMANYAMHVYSQQSLRNEINNDIALIKFYTNKKFIQQGCFIFIER